MALDATLREKLLGLTSEERAEVRRLLDFPELQRPKLTMSEWLEQTRELREEIAQEMARSGTKFDAVAEIRAIRDGL